jgi:hypothetical protein
MPVKKQTNKTKKTKIKKRRPCFLCGGKADVSRVYDTNCTNPTCKIYSINVKVDVWNELT